MLTQEGGFQLQAYSHNEIFGNKKTLFRKADKQLTKDLTEKKLNFC